MAGIDRFSKRSIVESCSILTMLLEEEIGVWVCSVPTTPCSLSADEVRLLGLVL